MFIMMFPLPKLLHTYTTCTISCKSHKMIKIGKEMELIKIFSMLISFRGVIKNKTIKDGGISPLTI